MECFSRGEIARALDDALDDLLRTILHYQAVRGALAEAKLVPEDIGALSVDTTCCTVVALNEGGEPLRPALLWMDMRSASQAGPHHAPATQAVCQWPMVPGWISLRRLARLLCLIRVPPRRPPRWPRFLIPPGLSTAVDPGPSVPNG